MIAKATRLIDADDRPVASASTDNTIPKLFEDMIPKHIQEDEEVAIPNLARLSARRAAADKVQVTPPQAEITETTATTKAGESATLQPQALPAQMETIAPAGTAAAGAPSRALGQRLNEESMGERMRQQGAPTFAESAKGISNMANQAKGDAAAEEDKKAKVAAAVPKFTLGDIMPAKSPPTPVATATIPSVAALPAVQAAVSPAAPVPTASSSALPTAMTSTTASEASPTATSPTSAAASSASVVKVPAAAAAIAEMLVPVAAAPAATATAPASAPASATVAAPIAAPIAPPIAAPIAATVAAPIAAPPASLVAASSPASTAASTGPPAASTLAAPAAAAPASTETLAEVTAELR